MDIEKLTTMLMHTNSHLGPVEGVPKLQKMEEDAGFAPSLLKVSTAQGLDMDVRLAAANHLKEMLENEWAYNHLEFGLPSPVQIQVKDQIEIRNTIIDSIVHMTDPIRHVLAICLNLIVRREFPNNYTQMVDKIIMYLQSSQPLVWEGGIVCLPQLVSNVNFYKLKDRRPLNEVVKMLLPKMYKVCIRLLPDESRESVWLQKDIFKTYFCFIKRTTYQNLISREAFTDWMEVLWTVLDRPVPQEIDTAEEPARTPWWKCKKWALRTLLMIFEKYGNPMYVAADHHEFLHWCLTTFSEIILNILLKILNQHKNHIYVSRPVLGMTLDYINQAVRNAFCWDILQPHIPNIIHSIIFPILTYSKQNEELWKMNAEEFARDMFDTFDHFDTPVRAARNVLHTCCMKQSNILDETITFVTQVLTSPDIKAELKDGTLKMLGNLTDVLLASEMYGEHLDNMLSQFVLPEFHSPVGALRIRACWMIERCCPINFRNEATLIEAIQLTANALLTDSEHPVKAGAAYALQTLLIFEEKSEQHLKPYVKDIILELVKMICVVKRYATTLLQSIINTYTEEVLPIAEEICSQLTRTLDHELDASEDCYVPTCIINILGALASVMKEHPKIMARMEPDFLAIFGKIFRNHIKDMYRETLSVMCDVTSVIISADTWELLQPIYESFIQSDVANFMPYMYVLYNFVTRDPTTLFSNALHVPAIVCLCRLVLSGPHGEDSKCHAAKLLQVILLHSLERVDPYIPSIVDMNMMLLRNESASALLRIMYLQVALSALYYNPKLLIKLLGPDTQIAEYMDLWILNTRYFADIHGLKLCILAFCKLLSLGEERPTLINEYANKIMASLIILFHRLQHDCDAKWKQRSEINHDTTVAFNYASNEPNEDFDEDLERQSLDITNPGWETEDPFLSGGNEDWLIDQFSFSTNIDRINEYTTFLRTIEKIQSEEPEFYTRMTSDLTNKQLESLKETLSHAETQRNVCDTF